LAIQLSRLHATPNAPIKLDDIGRAAEHDHGPTERLQILLRFAKFAFAGLNFAHPQAASKWQTENRIRKSSADRCRAAHLVAKAF